MNAKQAQLCRPTDIFVSPHNGEVFIADTSNQCVRKILRTGCIVTIAGTGEEGYNGDDQPATQAQLSFPTSVFVLQNDVYISEGCGHRIRKISSDGMITTIAGNGTQGFSGNGNLAVNSMLNSPNGLFVTDSGEVFFADYGNHVVRKIDSNGIITTVAGTGIRGCNFEDGLATRTLLFHPISVFVFSKEVYIADFGNHRIRKVLQNGMMTTIAGTGAVGYHGDYQLAKSTALNGPKGLYVHQGIVFFADSLNNRIRKINPNGKIKSVTVLNYDMETVDVLLVRDPSKVFIHKHQMYIADRESNQIHQIDNRIFSTIAGTGVEGYSGDVPFDFNKFPHIGRSQLIKPFPTSFYDIAICVAMHHVPVQNDDYEPVSKKVKYSLPFDD